MIDSSHIQEPSAEKYKKDAQFLERGSKTDRSDIQQTHEVGPQAKTVAVQDAKTNRKFRQLGLGMFGCTITGSTILYYAYFLPFGADLRILAAAGGLLLLVSFVLMILGSVRA